MYKMSFNLTLNSSNVVNGTTNNTYQYNFPNGSFNIPDGSEMAISQITIPYSWVNISSALGNNVLGYAIPQGSSIQYFYTTLPDRFYDISALNLALQTLFKTNGHYWSVLPSGATGSVNLVYYYPITISTNYALYTNTITSITILTSANIATVFGSGASSGSWGGTYPTTLLSTYNYASLFIPSTTSTSIGYILGFTGGNSIISPSSVNGSFYPTLGVSSSSINSNGNSLTSFPPFPAQGSTVNGVVVRCNLVSNYISNQMDILDAFPITSYYGNNINYVPIADNWIKVKGGKYNNLSIYFQDQNLNPLKIIDPNVLITLLIRFPQI